MKKMKDFSTQVLNLQEISDVETEKVVQKRKVVPLLLLIVSFFLIGIGFFYHDLSHLFIKNKKEEAKKQEVIEDHNKLKCHYKKDDPSLGVNYTYYHHYTFENRKLKKSKFHIVIAPLKNSEIAPSNIKVLKDQYDHVLSEIEKMEGIATSSKLKNNQLEISYTFDYNLLNPSEFPKNTLISIPDQLDEEYSSIKRKNQQSGYLC